MCLNNHRELQAIIYNFVIINTILWLDIIVTYLLKLNFIILFYFFLTYFLDKTENSEHFYKIYDVL